MPAEYTTAGAGGKGRGQEVALIACGAFVGSVTAPLLWLVATVVIWRETTTERAQRLRGAARGGVACPTCGYNLTGLTTTRCPECGTQFTLDELLAQQGGKYAGDLEGG